MKNESKWLVGGGVAAVGVALYFLLRKKPESDEAKAPSCPPCPPCSNLPQVSRIQSTTPMRTISFQTKKSCDPFGPLGMKAPECQGGTVSTVS